MGLSEQLHITYPSRNREVLLTVRPTGIPQPEHFRIVETDRPEPQHGEFLVRNIYLSVDPAQRGWASNEANYSAPVALGDPMRALAVSVVVRSNCEGLREGDFLYGWFGWQDYCVADGSKIVRRVNPAIAPLSTHAGLLGINGLTAFLALQRIGRPRAGETVLVSTAAGAVGSIVGQIAKLKGCRAIGLTGSNEKVDLCVAEYGYDAAVNYKTADVATALEELVPEGVDVYFDNVGGSILDIVVRHMHIGGRVVQCGTASIAAWDPPPVGLRNEREVLSRRLTWGGFVIFDHGAEFDSTADELARWYSQGHVKLREDIEVGIEGAPYAIQSLYAGENNGKKLLFVGHA